MARQQRISFAYGSAHGKRWLMGLILNVRKWDLKIWLKNNISGCYWWPPILPDVLAYMKIYQKSSITAKNSKFCCHGNQARFGTFFKFQIFATLRFAFKSRDFHLSESVSIIFLWLILFEWQACKVGGKWFLKFFCSTKFALIFYCFKIKPGMKHALYLFIWFVTIIFYYNSKENIYIW